MSKHIEIVLVSAIKKEDEIIGYQIKEQEVSLDLNRIESIAPHTIKGVELKVSVYTMHSGQKFLIKG